MEEKKAGKRKAVITGASSGIGYELSRELIKHGYDLIIISKNSTITEFEQEIDALVINISLGSLQEFFPDDTTEMETTIINQTITSSVQLLRRVLKRMLIQKQGKILFTIEQKENMPVRFKAIARACSAFLQSYLHSLRSEIQQMSEMAITLTEILPASPATHFSQTAAEIAHHGYQYMVAGEGRIECGPDKFISDEGKDDSPRAFGEPPRLKH